MIYGKHENYAADISIIQCKLSNLGSLDGPFDWQKLKVGLSIISINLVSLLNKAGRLGHSPQQHMPITVGPYYLTEVSHRSKPMTFWRVLTNLTYYSFQMRTGFELC